jgi:hypothetical protein
MAIHRFYTPEGQDAAREAVDTVVDLATAADAYLAAIGELTDALVSRYISESEVRGRRIVVATSASDCDAVAGRVAADLAAAGADVATACFWTQYLRRLPSNGTIDGDIAPIAKFYAEPFPAGPVDVIFVTSVISTPTELKYMTMGAIYDFLGQDFGEIAVIAPVTTINACERFRRMIPEEIGNCVRWLCIAEDDRIPLDMEVTPAMHRLGITDAADERTRLRLQRGIMPKVIQSRLSTSPLPAGRMHIVE